MLTFILASSMTCSASPLNFHTDFAVARIAGWSAHRIEELVSGGRIIRPAYKCVQKRRSYVAIEQRENQKA